MKEATIAEEHDEQLDNDLINLVQGISKTIPKQEFSDSGGEGIERSAAVDYILGFDDMHIEPVARSEGSGVSVERDSKVRETGNGAEDDLDLDRETVQRSKASGGLIEPSSLEQPPKESKVSNNIDSGNVERSEAIVSNVGEPGNIQAGDLDHENDNKSDETVDRSAGIAGSHSNVGEPGNIQAGDLDHENDNKSDETVDRSAGIAGSHSNVGEPGNIQAGDLDHENDNKSDETVDRSAGIAGSHTNVGQPGNVEAGALDRTDQIDSENVESSENFSGSRGTIVESISLELPIQQRSLVDYTDSESLLSNEGTGG